MLLFVIQAFFLKNFQVLSVETSFSNSLRVWALSRKALPESIRQGVHIRALAFFFRRALYDLPLAFGAT